MTAHCGPDKYEYSQDPFLAECPDPGDGYPSGALILDKVDARTYRGRCEWDTPEDPQRGSGSWSGEFHVVSP